MVPFEGSEESDVGSGTNALDVTLLLLSARVLSLFFTCVALHFCRFLRCCSANMSASVSPSPSVPLSSSLISQTHAGSTFSSEKSWRGLTVCELRGPSRPAGGQFLSCAWGEGGAPSVRSARRWRVARAGLWAGARGEMTVSVGRAGGVGGGGKIRQSIMSATHQVSATRARVPTARGGQ